MRPSRAELAVLGLLLVPAHSARGQAIGQGFDLERAGQYQRAAIIYFTTLRAEPTNLAALLGLERVLPSLSRLPELLPAAQRAVAAGTPDTRPPAPPLPPPRASHRPGTRAPR